MYQKLLAGIKRASSNSKRIRRPLKEKHLMKMLLHMSHLSPADRISFEAALLLVFYGFLRCSEDTVNCNNKNNFLRRKNIQFEGRKKVNLRIKLRKTNTDQFSTSFVQEFENKAVSCPVNAMRAYLQFFNHNRNDPLFWFQAQSLSSVLI